MKAFLIEMAKSLAVIFALTAFFGIAYQDRIWQPHYPVARAYNSHWQDNVNKKSMVCYQKMATIPEVKSCMFKLGAFI